MLNICRNGSVLIYSPANSLCITQIQRRFISRNTGINRGLRQEASGGRSEKPWESRNWEQRGRQTYSEPPLDREVKRAPYAKRWEDRSRQQQQQHQNAGGGPNSYEKRPYEKRPYQREGADGRSTRSHGDGEKKWGKTPYQQDQGDRGSTRSYGRGEGTHLGEQKPWEKRPYQRDRKEWGNVRSYGNNNRGTPSSVNDAEDAPLGFTRLAVGRNQDDGRQPQSNPTFRKERRESNYEVESDPISIPYTTAASEFLYGYNPVHAALKARRRKLYKIYIHPRVASREDVDDHIESLKALAEHAKVEIKEVDSRWLRVMDKMSDYRPHNVSP